MWYSSEKKETLKVKEHVLPAPHANIILSWPSVIVSSSMVGEKPAISTFSGSLHQRK
jgi:hypothetical protein